MIYAFAQHTALLDGELWFPITASKTQFCSNVISNYSLAGITTDIRCCLHALCSALPCLAPMAAPTMPTRQDNKSSSKFGLGLCNHCSTSVSFDASSRRGCLADFRATRSWCTLRMAGTACGAINSRRTNCG